MHCQTHVCDADDTSSRCALGCLSRGGRARREAGSESVSLVSSVQHGPVEMRFRRDADHGDVADASSMYIDDFVDMIILTEL